MIGYKKCLYLDVGPAGTKVKEALVTLEIDESSPIVRPINTYSFAPRTLKKLRCRIARVLDIVDAKTREPVICAFSDYSITNYFIRKHYYPKHEEPETICTYINGELVIADDLDEDVRNDCSNGIHFFLTEEEALNYRF